MVWILREFCLFGLSYCLALESPTQGEGIYSPTGIQLPCRTEQESSSF